MGGSRSMMMVMVMGIVVMMAGAVTMEEKCGADFQKLAVCLAYATGKAAAPTKDCCTSVGGIKESEPECLCFIMQQTHSGSDKIKSIGVQEAKLFQLPTACALKSASMADCPKLLGLAPNSKEAAIFSGNATTPPTTAKTTPATTSTPQMAKDSNSGTHFVAGPLWIAVAAIFLFMCSYKY